MNNSEVIKECRKAAKLVGLTFKTQGIRINSRPSYQFTDRVTGDVILSNCTLSGAYENVCSGFISGWNGARFKLKY
jgi:hypothetical protein